MRFTFTIALAALALTAGAGGVDADAVVFVEPAISGPSAAVTGGALGTQLTGSFRLDLHLGPRASGASQVSIRSFEITDAAQTGAKAVIIATRADRHAAPDSPPTRRRRVVMKDMVALDTVAPSP